MESIRQSIKSVLSVENHSKIIDQFARDRYLRKFPPSERDGLRYSGYHRYDGYEIISERELKVKYVYGAGDMDFDGYFIVEV